MKKFKLDKTFTIGTLYRAEPDKAYVFREAGTNIADKVSLRVAGIPCLDIRDELANIGVVSGNVSGLAPLEELFIVVPPDKPFIFESATSGSARVKGEILELAPGEVLPTNLAARFAEQGSRYLTFQRATKDIGTSWAKDVEHLLLDITTPVREEYTFKFRFGVDLTNLPAANDAPGNIAVRFYLEDKPLDIIEAEMGKHGIDFWGCRLPPDFGKTWQIGTLADFAIVLTEGINLKLRMRNISGAGITAAAAMVLRACLYYERKLL